VSQCKGLSIYFRMEVNITRQYNVGGRMDFTRWRFEPKSASLILQACRIQLDINIMPVAGWILRDADFSPNLQARFCKLSYRFFSCTLFVFVYLNVKDLFCFILFSSKILSGDRRVMTHHLIKEAWSHD